ncbi:hypothetical protein ACFSOZ_06800 [Mesorhizobium newzealandense]|uniref:HEPN AbiU2-like domain-containing protein n=1 Tax=Mesorhizobium newzealandense TaxID=1300302 RepID=A0ABW4U4V7_9HYPH
MTNPLKGRIKAIEKLEKEFIKKAAVHLDDGDMYLIHMFLLGAAQRTLCQSRGFRHLIESKNFPSATVLLRTQIDTAMRMNALPLIQDRESSMKRLMANEVQFDRLTTMDGGKQERLTDAYLRKRLSAEHPWIDKVYTETSDFVHLSFRHLWTAVAGVEDETRTVRFALSGMDAQRPQSDYFEVCDAFAAVSKLAYTMILASWGPVRTPQENPDQDAA